jgi:hypothetical protein
LKQQLEWLESQNSSSGDPVLPACRQNSPFIRQGMQPNLFLKPQRHCKSGMQVFAIIPCTALYHAPLSCTPLSLTLSVRPCDCLTTRDKGGPPRLGTPTTPPPC